MKTTCRTAKRRSVLLSAAVAGLLMLAGGGALAESGGPGTGACTQVPPAVAATRATSIPVAGIQLADNATCTYSCSSSYQSCTAGCTTSRCRSGCSSRYQSCLVRCTTR